nr:PAS domain-containing protein [Sphingomicrobium lutaoense]
MQSSHLAMSLADAGEGDMPLIAANDGFRKLTGYADSEIVGRNCRFLQHDLREQPGLDAIRLMIADQGRETSRSMIINFRKDGTPFVNLLTLTRLRDATKKTRFMFASQYDVTHTAPRELAHYDDRLVAAFRSDFGERESNQFLIGSIHAITDAAVTIAQARMLLEEADRAGSLY